MMSILSEHASGRLASPTGFGNCNGHRRIEQIAAKEAYVAISVEHTPFPSIFVEENAPIPTELHARSDVYVLDTIGDARQALSRLRELRRDFAAAHSACQSGGCIHSMPQELPGKGENQLAGLSNIQRMRTIRKEIAYIEDLMVRIAEREFLLEEKRHCSYLSDIGQWRERGATRPVI